MMNTDKSCVRFLPSAKYFAEELGVDFKLFISIAMVGLTVFTSGCENYGPNKLGAVDSATTTKGRLVKITAVGYGAASANDAYSPGQKRLIAMRTSKLDAYRALAEQVQGVRVNGNSTVASMISQNDSFRVYVDAYLRGAQLIAVTPMADGNYETTMELSLDDRFFDGFAPQAGAVYSGNVRGSTGPGYNYSNTSSNGF